MVNAANFDVDQHRNDQEGSQQFDRDPRIIKLKESNKAWVYCGTTPYMTNQGQIKLANSKDPTSGIIIYEDNNKIYAYSRIKQ